MNRDISQLATVLRERRPARIVLEDADGEEVPIAIAKRGHRYEAAAGTICGYDWRRVLTYNADGEACGPPIVAETPDQAAPEPAIQVPDSPEGKLLTLVLAGQASVMKHHREVLDPVMEGYRATIEMLTERLQATEVQRERDVRMLDAITSRMLAERLQLADQVGEQGGTLERDVMGALMRRMLGGGARGAADDELPSGSPS